MLLEIGRPFPLRKREEEPPDRRLLEVMFFLGEEKFGGPKEKPLWAKERTNNNSYTTSPSRRKPGPIWQVESALTITLYRGALLCLKTLDLRQSGSDITDTSGSTAVWDRNVFLTLTLFTTDIVENCLFIIWRHLDFYFLHCIPSDEERRMLAGPTLAGSRMRRLQGIRLRVRILVKLSANLEKNIDSYYSFAAVTRAQLPRYHRSHHSKMQNFESLSVLNIWSFTFLAYLNIGLHWIFLRTALIDYVFLSTVRLPIAFY